MVLRYPKISASSSSQSTAGSSGTLFSLLTLPVPTPALINHNYHSYTVDFFKLAHEKANICSQHLPHALFFWNCNLMCPLCSRGQYSVQHRFRLDDHHLTMANYLWYNWMAFLKDTEKSENAWQSNKYSDTCHYIRFLQTLRVFFFSLIKINHMLCSQYLDFELHSSGSKFGSWKE